MTIDERLDALSDDDIRNTLRKVVFFAEAHGAPRPLAKILRQWSLLGSGERQAEVKTNRPIGEAGNGIIYIPVDDYDTETSVRHAIGRLMPGVGVVSVTFMRKATSDVAVSDDEGRYPRCPTP